MFTSKKLQRLFISALLTCALSVYAAPAGTGDLVITLSAPSTAKGVDELKIKVTVTNTGNETLQLLKDPRTLLVNSQTNSFKIASDGGSPAFEGKMMKFVPEKNKKNVQILQPGKAFSVVHELNMYDFTKSGEGTYQIAPSSQALQFSAVDANTSKIEKLQGKTDPKTTSVKIKLSGQLKSSTSRPSSSQGSRPGSSGKSKRAGPTFSQCNTNQETAIKEAVKEATTYAKESETYLKANKKGTPRYVEWFGTFQAVRHTKVLDIFEKMVKQGFDSYTYVCDPSPGTYAYVYPTQFGVVYVCDDFFDANTPLTGTDSKAGTLVHETSHFPQIGDTEDHAYGHTDAQDLARNDPDKAIENADNYEFFAENTPHLA